MIRSQYFTQYLETFEVNFLRKKTEGEKYPTRYSLKMILFRFPCQCMGVVIYSEKTCKRKLLVMICDNHVNVGLVQKRKLTSEYHHYPIRRGSTSHHNHMYRPSIRSVLCVVIQSTNQHAT